MTGTILIILILIRFHIQAEVTKICFEIKETILGDPKFSNFNFDDLISEQSINKMLNKINLDKVANQIKLMLLHIQKQFI